MVDWSHYKNLTPESQSWEEMTSVLESQDTKDNYALFILSSFLPEEMKQAAWVASFKPQLKTCVWLAFNWTVAAYTMF